MAKLNEKDLQACANLKRIWIEYKEENEGATQVKVAKDLGYSQPNFNSYLNGSQKIGIDALVKFADYFGCKCSDIREELKG